MKKGSIFARCYVKMIIWGKRTIDDVKPKALQDEVIELLKKQGLGVDGKPLKAEDPIETEPTNNENKPIENKDNNTPNDEKKSDSEPSSKEQSEANKGDEKEIKEGN